MKEESRIEHLNVPSAAEYIRCEQVYVRERDAAAYGTLHWRVAYEVQRLQDDLLRFLHRCEPEKVEGLYEGRGRGLWERIVVVIERASEDLEYMIQEEAEHLEHLRERTRPAA